MQYLNDSWVYSIIKIREIFARYQTARVKLFCAQNCRVALDLQRLCNIIGINAVLAAMRHDF